MHEIVQKLIVFCIAGYGLLVHISSYKKTIRDLRGMNVNTRFDAKVNVGD